MKLPRRRFLHLAAVAVALPMVSGVAWAQTYPSRPVRWVVPYPAGGPADFVARLMGQWLSERLGQQFVIDNRPGAANIGTEAVVRAQPDGYTLLLVDVVHAINATLYDKLNFNFIRDIVPIAGIIRVPLVMVVNPLVPAKTVPEFIAYAKSNPGKIKMASGGNGTGVHVAGELFKMMTGVDMPHVAYRGALLALAAVIGGDAQVIFIGTAPAIEHIRTGRLSALAVTGAARSEVLPEVPTVGEFLPGYEVSGWQGIGAPKNTSVEVIDKLNKEINAGLADPKIRGRFGDLGLTVLAGSPADFGKLIADETEKWGKVIRAANIKL
jgi:tripartite-type tricarboxylate transporter receptor subunit TctC